MGPFDNLLRKIESHQAVVGVIGMGYVGLPLAVTFAKAGFAVMGFDVDSAKVAGINAGRSHVADIPTEVLAPYVASGALRATSDFADLRVVDTVSICVPTPLRKTKDPDMSYILEATRAVATRLRMGQLIVLESTTYPGTTTEVLLPALAAGGLTVGSDFFLAFSPERIDPGNPTYGTKNTPKIVGGVTAKCAEAAKALYGAAIDRVVSVSSPAAAEMVKLLENTFRAVNIGLVNEVSIMCEKLGVDVWEVIDAAATKPFGFMPFYPGPGWGGHCIPVDPHYLAWKMKHYAYNARFIQLADEVNSEMPHRVLERISQALNGAGKPVRGSAILVIGAAYKRDVADVRESPALDIIGHLIADGGLVSYHDPFVPSFKHDGFSLASVALTPEAVAKQDCVVIATDHTCVDWPMVAANAKLVVDTRNVVPKRS